MSYDVVVVAEFEAWYRALDEAAVEAVNVVVGLLGEHGPQLGYPYSSKVESARRFALRELRKQHRGQPIRILYCFDPSRSAVLLLGGDKTGNDRWYHVSVPLAERRMAAYLEETGQA